MEKEIGKYKIEVIQDEYADSPDSFGNDGAFVVYDHNQFNVERKGFEPRDIFDHSQERPDKLYDGYFFFVLYAYIHSGVRLSVGNHNFPDARWDVSSTGYVLVKKQKYTYTRKQPSRWLKVLQMSGIPIFVAMFGDSKLPIPQMMRKWTVAGVTMVKIRVVWKKLKI